MTLSKFTSFEDQKVFIQVIQDNFFLLSDLHRSTLKQTLLKMPLHVLLMALKPPSHRFFGKIKYENKVF